MGRAKRTPKRWRLLGLISLGRMITMRQRAVLKFAKQDTRDYATFPAPGVLVKLIEEEQGLYKRVFNKMFNRVAWDALSQEEQSVVKREDYEWGRMQEPEYLLAHRDNFLGKLKLLEE